MRATIVFHTPDRHRGWSVTKNFNDELHLDNFINHIERTKHGFQYDEHYIQRETTNTQTQ